MKRSSISVVIPVWNRADIVGRTLESLAVQTLSPARIILVDNNSGDDSLAVLRSWAAGRDNVEVLQCMKPGAAAARNVGLERVTSEYVYFFDSDDVMPPRLIEEIQSGLERLGYPSVAAFDMNLVGLDGSLYPKPFRHGDPMFNQLFHSILSTQRCVIRTATAREAGAWNEDLPVWNDFEFGVRLIICCREVKYIKLSDPVVAYAQIQSITGTGFTGKAGRWEHTLDTIEHTLQASAVYNRYARYIDWRRAILAGFYMREGHSSLATPLLKHWWMKPVAKYVSLGGRGVAYAAKLF